MNICIHGKAAEGRSWRVPYGRFFGCVNVRRAIMDIEFCGKIPEDCQGRYEDYLGNKDRSCCKE